MRVINAPNPVNLLPNEGAVFLAGSIEMGKAEMWQDRVIESLKDIDKLVILNPRRPDWDNSWECTSASQKFREQVEWEQHYLVDVATISFFYFSPGTLSPISLLELGEVLGYCMFPNPIVVCPEGYGRKGNVDITCEHCGVSVLGSLDEGITQLKEFVQ